MARKKTMAAKRKAMPNGVVRVLAAVRTAKASASGRLFDELHNAESRIIRAAEGRKSTFNYAAKKKAKQGPKK